MTILLTLVGLVVFFISLFTATFKKAFKRLVLFALTGVFIDMLLISLSMAVTFINLRY